MSGSSCNAISASEALKVVASFFTDEWPQTSASDVQVQRLTGGYSNTTHIVRRSSLALKEPSSVLLRHVVGNFSEKEFVWKLKPAEESVVFFEMSRRGWGPKLYGLSGDYLVMEFIDSHTLTPEDCDDPTICRDVARSYARIHTLDMPFMRSKVDVCIESMMTSIEVLVSRQNEIKAQIMAVDHPDAKHVAHNLFSLDFGVEMKWIQRLTKEIPCKRVLTHSDINFLNVLVRNDVDSECRVLLVDYEIVMYSYRAFDIGGHFVNRMLSWNGKDSKLSGRPFPSLDERRVFCQFYRQSLEEEGQKLTPSDSVEHLLLEGEIGALYYTCFVPFTLTQYLDHFITEPSFLSGIRLMLELHQELKDEFTKKHLSLS